MLAVKGGWVGQTFALATSSDAGGKKSRIRRSKQERKILVESFINKYQESNNGIFPSLNLTHKEVGGSFYTVREIVREIIQENRVLAPPKVSLEEHNHSVFLKQHALESISVESNNEDIIDELSKVDGKYEESDKASTNHHVTSHYQDSSTGEVSHTSGQLPQPKDDKIDNEKAVNGDEGLEENVDCDEQFITNGVVVIHQDHTAEGADVPSQETHGLGSQSHGDEQYPSKDDKRVDKTEASEEEIHVESVVTSEKARGEDVEVAEVVTSHMNTNFAVETSPSVPNREMIIGLDGESGKLHEADDHDKMPFDKSNGLLTNKDQEKLDFTMELSGEHSDGKVIQNLQEQEPSFDSLNLSVSFSDETEACNSTEGLMSNDSMEFVTKSRVQDNLLKKGNNPMLERLNLETWDRTSKKSNRTDNNPLVTFVKSFISAFMKFWTQ